MKRVICLICCLILSLSVCAGCSNIGSKKAPDEVKNVKWTTYDYSFSFNTADNCKGSYSFDGKTYDVTVAFESSYVTVTDNSNGKKLWDGQWQYREGNELYIYAISYNTDDYKEFKTNYAEFYDLKREKVKN